MSEQRYDAIVIGAGANGLVAAHYLARAGKRVVVFEQETAENPSFDIGWVPSQIIKDLGLNSHGLQINQPDPWITIPLSGGGTLELSRDVGRASDAIRRVSSRDAAQWPEFCARMHTLAGVLERLYLVAPPDIETRNPRELARIAGLGVYVRRLGKQAVIDLARILPMSISELLDDWFENDALKGALGAVGIWHLKQGPRSGGTAFNFLHHHVGNPSGVFRPAMSNLTSTLLKVPGVEIRRGQEVYPTSEPTLRVITRTGDPVEAQLVLSSIDPRRTFMISKDELDAEFVRAIDNIKCRGVVARGTVTLDARPTYANWCVAPSLEYLERAYDDAKYGRLSESPYVEIQRANGRVEIHVQYVPFTGQPSQAPSLKERVARMIDVQPDQLELSTPNGWDDDPTEGNLYHGELTLDQILFMRPVPGWSRYRTPIEGLYLCGSGTHPGGGIPGAAGRNAAREIA
ncbi:MAG: phytoene desaturase family protein [Gemmatimonadota bacterium]